MQNLNKNFEKAAPILLWMEKDKKPVYMAQRVFFNYMSELNMTLDNEPVFTDVSTRAGGDDAFCYV